MKLLTALIIAGIVLSLVLVTDCTLAAPRWVGGVVTDKIYEPQTVSVSTDSEGHVSTTTSGPNYYIVVRVNDCAGRVNVTGWQYDQWQRDDEGMVQFRRGRIMDYGFLSIRRP